MDASIRGRLLRGRDSRPPDGRTGIPKKLLIGGGAVMLALAAAAPIDWPWSDETVQIDSGELDEQRGPVTIEAEELHQAFKDDPNAAAERFDGREMVVSGEFLRIVPDGYGSLDLRIKSSDPNDPLGVDVAQVAIEDAKTLRPGQRVTVSCQQMGSGGDELWVQDCAIQFEGDAAPASAAPSAPAQGEDQEPEAEPEQE